MADRILGPQGSKRRRRFLWVPMLAMAALALFVIASAQAVHDTGVFQLDRNATTSVDSGVVAAAHDWDQVCKDATASSAVPLCTTVTGSSGAQSVTFDPDKLCPVSPQCTTANGNDASVYTGGGSKDFSDIQTSWLYKDGSTPDKDNLQHGFSARYSMAPDTSPPTLCPAGTNPTCELLFFGADRIDASGDSQIGFWFFQNRIELTPTPSNGGFKFSGLHKDGDILVLSDFTQGGGTPNIKIYEWNFDPTPGTDPSDDGAIAGGGNGSCKTVKGEKVCDDLTVIGGGANPADCIGPPTVGTGDGFCATVNATTTSSPWPFTDKSNSTSFLPGEFYEGGINLSLLPAGIASECFASFEVEQRASADADAVLKDFILGNFGNCTANLSTQVSSTSVNPSTAVHDTATIVGNKTNLTPSSPPNVNFFLCTFAAGTTDLCDGSDAAHTGSSIGSGALSGSGGTATATSPNVNTAASPLAPGRYCFRAEWNGDTNYPTKLVEYGQDSDTSVECFNVVQSPTTTTTEPRLASDGTAITAAVNVGTHVVDHARVDGATGLGNPTGAVNFFICNPSQTTGSAGSEVCATGGTALGGNPVTATVISGASPPATEATSSPDVVANVVGVWCFRAEYVSNTGNYTNSSDARHSECFTVRDQSSLSSAQNWTPQDHVTLTSTGSTNLNGSLEITLREGSCTGTTIRSTNTFNSPTGGWTSGTTFDTTNTYVVNAANNATPYYWRVVFTSSDPLVDGFTKCEHTDITITD